MLRLAGNLHDIGKASPDFQAYIAGQRSSGGDHSSAGARIALGSVPDQLFEFVLEHDSLRMLGGVSWQTSSG